MITRVDQDGNGKISVEGSDARACLPNRRLASIRRIRCARGEEILLDGFLDPGNEDEFAVGLLVLFMLVLYVIVLTHSI